MDYHPVKRYVSLSHCRSSRRSKARVNGIAENASSFNPCFTVEHVHWGGNGFATNAVPASEASRTPPVKVELSNELMRITHGPGYNDGPANIPRAHTVDHSHAPLLGVSPENLDIKQDELGVHQTGIIFEGLDTSSAAQCDPEATNDVKRSHWKRYLFLVFGVASIIVTHYLFWKPQIVDKISLELDDGASNSTRASCSSDYTTLLSFQARLALAGEYHLSRVGTIVQADNLSSRILSATTSASFNGTSSNNPSMNFLEQLIQIKVDHHHLQSVTTRVLDRMIAGNINALAILQAHPRNAQKSFIELSRITSTDITVLKNKTLTSLATAKKFLNLCDASRSLFYHPGHTSELFAQLNFFAHQRRAQLEEASAVLDVLQGSISQLVCQDDVDFVSLLTEDHILILEYGIQRLRDIRGHIDLQYEHL